MPYFLVLITEQQIKEGAYWEITKQFTRPTVGADLVEENVLQLSRDVANTVASYSAIADINRRACLSDKLNGQIMVAQLYEGEGHIDNLYAMVCSIVFNADVTAVGTFTETAGPLICTANENHVWLWASVLLPTESDYYPHAYR